MTKKKKIDFQSLYKKFKFKVIKHFLITVLRIILSIILSGVFYEIFRTNKSLKTASDYISLLPESSQRFFKPIIKGRKDFVIIGILLVIIYSLVHYWDSLQEEELRIRGGHYTKNILLDKFRSLPLEKRIEQKDNINNLVEKDSDEVGYYWEHLPNHIFHSLLTIFGILIFHWGKFTEMTFSQSCFSLLWLVLVNSVVFFFTKKILESEEEYKKNLSKESSIINEERSNSVLIESSGLVSHYKFNQKQTTRKNQKFLLNFNYLKSLNKVIPNYLLIWLMPFILLVLSGDGFIGIILVVFWEIFDSFSEIFKCLWDYSDYASSCARINRFLALPEKNDNLSKLTLPLDVPIVVAHFENVSFHYAQQKNWILKNYSRVFSQGEINYLLGKNGFGKSTILYLLLGLLIPQEGNIIIEDANKKCYNLHRDINLQSWRENNLAYASHETLLREGSTGQRQLNNIKNLLQQKRSAQIWLFDEADNALDDDNKMQVKKELTKLVEEGKIVVCIEHAKRKKSKILQSE